LILAIASSTDAENIRALLRSSFNENLEPWFETIAAGETVDKKKPAPDIDRQALTRLRLAVAQRLAFEGSANGLHATRAAGIQAIVTGNADTRNNEFAGAAVVIEELSLPRRSSGVETNKKILVLPKRLDLTVLTRIHADASATP
jgi:beta-phosphoglucomutase-like phosphatase (HAD superfamily)